MNAATDGATATLDDVFSFEDMTEFSDDPLAAIEHLRREALEHGVDMTPDPGSVQSWSVPIVFTRISEADPEVVGRRISPLLRVGTELEAVEFKSTMWLDLNRRNHDPNAGAGELKSTAVCNSSMKTICGFLNEAGGSLVVGAADDGSIVGIEEEFFVACPDDETIDGWLQQARSTVFQFFHEPEEVWQHLKFEVGRIGERHVVLVKVVKRSKLSFCKCKFLSDFKVYSRRATSTDEVNLTSIEAYVLGRARLE